MGSRYPCITIAANIADTAILGIKGCFPDSIIGFVADNEEADVRFIKYSIDHMRLRMRQVSHGTTQDNLSMEKLRPRVGEISWSKNLIVCKCKDKTIVEYALAES